MIRKLYLSLCLLVLCVLHSRGQVPVLNSYPSASAVILLDFDGHYVKGTSWNWNGPFTCGPANLTTAQIQEIFNRVAEDYRPFNLNVTTDTTRYWAAPARRRTRVVFTVTNEWYCTNCGGVASNNSFSRGDNTPCFVFTKLQRYVTKNIAEAASHEAGHTLGLRHQTLYNDSCGVKEDYNNGEGTGQVSWAPIMGVGYDRNVTTWHVGTSSRACTFIQSDVDVITSLANGITFRTDDHANKPAGATPAAITQDSLIAEGLIEQSTDFDYFSFRVNNISAFHLEARPYSLDTKNTGANLKVNVALVDSTETEIANYSSFTQLSETIDTVLKPGTYYLKVDGASTQYFSDYGSLGKYSLAGSLFPATILPLRQLKLQGSARGATHLLHWLVDADEAIEKQVLEMATDGIHFTAIKELGVSERQWQQAAGLGSVQYRLRVWLRGGREHHSNVIVLQGTDHPAARPRLAANLVSGSVITMVSPVVFRYQVCDMSGKVLLRGSGGSGSLSVAAPSLAPGMYLVKFNDNGKEYVEKLLKK